MSAELTKDQESQLKNMKRYISEKMEAITSADPNTERGQISVFENVWELNNRFLEFSDKPNDYIIEQIGNLLIESGILRVAGTYLNSYLSGIKAKRFPIFLGYATKNILFLIFSVTESIAVIRKKLVDDKLHLKFVESLSVQKIGSTNPEIARPILGILYNLLQKVPFVEREMKRYGLVAACLELVKSTRKPTALTALFTISSLYYNFEDQEIEQIVQAVCEMKQLIIGSLLTDALNNSKHIHPKFYIPVADIFQCLFSLTRYQDILAEILTENIILCCAKSLQWNFSKVETKCAFKLLERISSVKEGLQQITENSELCETLKQLSGDQDLDISGPAQRVSAILEKNSTTGNDQIEIIR